MNLTNLTLTQLRVLVAIEETASFTTAAHRLHLTQPAVSHAVRNLEQCFGVALFERRRDGVWPTDPGRAAIAEARRALHYVTRLESAVHCNAGTQVGVLRLACFASAINWGLPAMFSEFKRRLPGVMLEIQEIADETSLRALRNGTLDLGMVNMPCAGLDTFPLFEDEMYAVVRAAESCAEDSIRLEQLVSEPFVLPRGACEPLIRAAFTSAGLHPRVAVSAAIQGSQIALSMVRQGMGFTLLPGYALTAETTRGLRALRLQPTLIRRVAFAAASERPLSPVARQFLDIVRQMQPHAPAS